ncbi:MAG TPA: hypothetical protein VND19_17475 [Acetobacteraceae bacterium]|nr:hypothetical protein [Acetobacteraceae bacterium]
MDPTNDTTLPGAAADLATPDAQDLRHQMQLANGFAGGAAGGGWTILPRIEINEAFNDNVLQVNAPRRWDLETLVTPGVSVIGDLPRLQVRLDYAPTVEMFARDGPQNSLIQQLNGTGLVTVVPDLAFIDLRAFAGAEAANGLIGGIGPGGSLGEAGAGTLAGAASNTLGIAKNNRTQTDNFGISPYLLHTFGDYGTAKLGYSMSLTTSDTTSGFAPSPYPSSNTQGTSLVTTEQIAEFTSGDVLSEWQNALDVDLTQTTTKTDQQVSATGTVSAIPRTTIGSSRQIISDKLSYAATHWATIFATFGHENISYTTAGFRSIDDFTWSAGTDLQPDPNSDLTVSYGHQNGFDSLQASGRYALSARTTVIGSYSETLGTQLEQVNSLVQFGVIGPNGQFIDGANGAPLLFSAYQPSLAPSVFHYRTFDLNVQTILDRDIISLGAVVSEQTSVGRGTQSALDTKSATLQWQRDLRPDLSLTSYAAYTTQSQSGGGGFLQSLVIGATLNYILTDTLTAHLRYIFNDRNASSVTNRMYQNLVVVGITKQF